MRIKRTTQLSVFQSKPVDHPLGGELESISNWLDAHPALLDAVAADLGAQSNRGHRGLSCDSILRCAVLKHLRGKTWRGLAFAPRDSRSACRFSRVDPLSPPGKSALPVNSDPLSHTSVCGSGRSSRFSSRATLPPVIERTTTCNTHSRE